MADETIQQMWFKGDLLVARWTGNTLGGFSGPLNGMKVSLKPDGDPKRIQSNMLADFGQSKKLSYMPKPTEAELELSDITRPVLAAALLGTDSAYSQDAETTQSATVTLIEGQYVKLPHINVSNVAISGKVEGTDYVVLEKLGMVKALDSATAGSKSVTYDAGAVAGDKIIGGTNNVVDFSIEMLVENNSDGKQGILRIPKISVTPAKAMELLGAKDYQTLAFKGEVISLPGQELFTFMPNLAFS
jgi:hypothetical protein